MKFIQTFAVAACLTIAACDAGASEPQLAPPLAADAVMTPEQVRADVGLAKEAFERVHPGYTRYATKAEMDAQWQAIIDQAYAKGGMSLPEFYLASELALVAIRCDHTKAELPRSMRAAREGMPVYLPMRWRMIEGRALVETAGEGTGLNFGDEILSIDGRTIDQLVEELVKYVPVDGYTEWSRANELSQSLEFMGGGVDHFGALMWDVPEVATLEVRSAVGETRTVEVKRTDFAAWSALGEKSQANFKDAVTFKRIGENAAYLSVDTFVNYRDPVKPKVIYDPIFAAMKKENRDTLILDLRKNGGGSSDANYGLLANLLTEQFRPRAGMIAKTLDMDGIRPYLWTWDKRALDPNPMGFSKQDDGTYALRSFVSDDLKTVKPTKNAFDGELIVLTSHTNSSGSTNFISWMTELGRATTVGEKTGGSKEGPTAGLQFTLTLPNSGVRMRLPFFHVKNNVKSFEKGLGVTPEISAPLTVEAFREGRDPALEAALQLANSEGPTVEAGDFAVLQGNGWEGTLNYLNYGSDQRSQIPVKMIVEAPQKRRVPYGFIYPGEESKNANDAIRISQDGMRISGMNVVSRSLVDGALVIVAEGTGSDDNRPAEIRMTYTIAANRFSVRKDVRFAGGDFINRNEYRLTR